MNISEKISQILQGLSKGIYEKEEVIRLALLAAVAGESIFLLGPPGVAKSLIARRLKYAFKDGKSFEYLMSRFSTPDEIFGPVSIRKLKDEDRYERLTEKYLPGSNIVFLDEIWKAGPSIQNALLTILNEKIYRNGEQEIQVDIKCILSASNELPAHSEGLEALWDRFLIRYVITEIREKGNFLNMILNTEDVFQDHIGSEMKISNAELEAWDEQINAVELPSEVLNTIQLLKHRIEEHDNKHPEQPFAIFDRRWKKAVRLLRTSAFLNGRTQADLMDCFLLVHCLWSHPWQMEKLKEMLAEIVRKHGYSIALNLTTARREIEELEEEVKEETRVAYTSTTDALYLIDHKYYEVLQASNLFEGKYVRYQEFERLVLDEFNTIGLYDENQKLTYKIKARRAKTENQVEIYHNSQTHVLPMKTEKVESKTYLYKKPHPLIAAHWGARCEQLTTYLQASLQKFQHEAEQHGALLRKHLFVPPSLADLVEANRIDAIHAIQSLLLRVEKTKHYYQTVGQ